MSVSLSQTPFTSSENKNVCETVIVREATLNDYAEVLSIANVYDGRDYIPSKYKHFVTSAVSKGYVGIVNGNIVSFLIVSFVDDGRTVVTRAGRVREDYRGRGVYGKMKQLVRNELALRNQVESEMFTTSDVNYEKHNTKFRHMFTERFYKNVSSSKFQISDTCMLQYSLSLNLLHLHFTDFNSLFSSPETCKYLFPHNTIVVDWVPLKLLPTNINYILSSTSLALASRSPNCSWNDVSYSLLTIGSYYMCFNCIAYQLDVYGTDVTQLHRHLLAHVENIVTLTANETCETAWLEIYTDPDVDRSEVRSALCEMCLPQTISTTTVMHVLEKPFKHEIVKPKSRNHEYLVIF